MKKRFFWQISILAALAVLASAKTAGDQTVDGVTLDVTSLTSDGPQKMVQLNNDPAPVEEPEPQVQPDNQSQEPSQPLPPPSEARSAESGTTEASVINNPEPQATAASTTSAPVAAPATPPPPPPVETLHYEVVERRPDFVYRPGRLEFQMQPSYRIGQTNLAVGPGVRSGRTRYVPLGQF